MGRLKLPRIKGLRQRWLVNTVCVICAVGVVCVALVTMLFANYYYSTMESDMRYRAKTTAEYFKNYLDQDYGAYYQSCITYAQNFADKDEIELQFINAQGRIVASSYGSWAGRSPTTPEITQAVSTRGICPFVGKDPQTGERIMAVSAPMIYSNGEVIGVLRYVTSTHVMDMQILRILALSVAVMLLAGAVVLFSGGYYIRSVVTPLRQMIDTSRQITNGSYGIQIKPKYDDEVGELAEAINEMSIKINQNEKMQTEFISNLSHELRTPLTAITGWSETLLTSEDLDDGTRRGAGIILREANRLTEMVVDLLDFTRIQDGRMTLNIEPTDIRSEFEDTVYMYSSRLRQEGIRLEYQDTDEEIPEISCDPKRLRQVFLNLLDNAAKHGGEGKRIDAAIGMEDGFVTVWIRDYGPGIPEDELPLVKKKFYKGSSKARGSGIGLAVCDEIVQMHGGSLELTNASGGGTLVTVRIAKP